MPGWIILVRKKFSVNKWVCREKTIENVLKGLQCFLFFHGFHLKKLKIIKMIFELFLNDKDNRVFMSQNYRSDS